MSKKGTNGADVLVGRNIRNFRLEGKLTTTELAERVGISRSQIESYESAVHRVPASRLARIADVLNVPVATLFDGSATIDGLELQKAEAPPLPKPDALRLLQAFNRIPGKRMRRAILRFFEDAAKV